MITRAVERCPEIEAVYLFGSQARGDANVRSDADLFVILSHSPHVRRMDRIPALLEAMDPLPMPVDIVPWTEAEYRSGCAEQHPWLATIMGEAKMLFQRPEGPFCR